MFSPLAMRLFSGFSLALAEVNGFIFILDGRFLIAGSTPRHPSPPVEQAVDMV